MSDATLILFAKYPVPGRAKTRLIPALGADGAAALHRRLAKRTFDTMVASGHRIEVQYDLASEAEFRDWLGNDADYVQQPEGDLTDRLLAASRDTPHVFFGADTPDLTTDIAHDAADLLIHSHDVVIGPAEDGGYYLIGMKYPLPQLFTDMPWSTDQVLPTTLKRLQELDIEPFMLPMLADCDRPEDLQRWPELAAGL